MAILKLPAELQLHLCLSRQHRSPYANHRGCASLKHIAHCQFLSPLQTG